MPKLKLTKTAVDRIPTPDTDRVDYFDTDLAGFGVRASRTAKTYFVLSRVNGVLKRVSLGRHGVMTTDRARTEAMKRLAEMNEGVDPNRRKIQERVRGITFQQVYDAYLTARPQMKRNTITVDKSLLSCHLSDWLKKPIQEITKDMVARRHLKISEDAGQNTANNAMRLFRRIYNFARSISDDEMPLNPVQRLSDSRQWFKVGRRQTVIKEHELPVWHTSLQNVANPVIRDFLLLLLLTGLRKNEALGLRWQDVDMQGKSFTIPETKNGKPHTLPMSDLLLELFSRRLDERVNGFVFPGAGKAGHLVEPKKQVAAMERQSRLLMNNVSTEAELQQMIANDPDSVNPGLTFCLHDLRRTFASIAENEVSYSVLKRLMNHSDKDVTQGYIVLNIEKLRLPMQQITNTIRELLTEKQPAKVISMEDKRAKRKIAQ